MRLAFKVLAVVVAISMLTAGIGVYLLYYHDAGGTNLSDIEGYVGDIEGPQKSYLNEHDFVLIRGDSKGIDTFTEVYKDLNERHLPVFVTSDAVLHTYHVFYDDTLRKVEEEELHPAAVNLTKGMLDMSEEQYEATSGQIKEAALRNVAYFSVAKRLLDPTAQVPSYVEEVVDEEIALIDDHSVKTLSPIFKDTDLPISEDYTQYIPRGHYTRSEVLKSYFKAMMWYGRITMPLKSVDITVGALLLTDGLEHASVGGVPAMQLWYNIYNITSRFVGESDDLTPMDYYTEASKVWGALPSDYAGLNDADKIATFKTAMEAYPDPAIAPQYGKGLRFMGQRYIPDSHMFQELVFDKILDYTGERTGDDMPFTYVPELDGRGFPRGLDVMSILGSEKADEILEAEGDTDYVNYDEQMSKLKTEFDQLPEEIWTSNMYWGWLNTLSSLTGDLDVKGSPSFMRDDDWQKVKLNTDLASWAELRHDTILYAKQSETLAGSAPTDRTPQPTEKGYVEPVPEFYQRLVDLTVSTKEDLRDNGMLSDERGGELDAFANMLERFRSMAEKELKGEELSSSDYSYLRSIGKKMEGLTGSAHSDGLQTTIVADVHTDVNSNKVLEEGVGYVDFIVIKVKRADGTEEYLTGPIFSYYEFKHPSNDRLTDEKWTGMLEDGTAEGRQDWMKECYGG